MSLLTRSLKCSSRVGWVVLVSFAAAKASSALGGVPSFAEVKAKAFPSEAVLYDRHNQVIHEKRFNSRFRQLPWTSLDAVSPVVKKAILLSEDHRFANHSGVDWIAALGSGAENLFRKRPRGASTVTMQLVALLNKDLMPKRASKGRAFTQKFRQILEARELEKVWSKNQIFEAYLNLVPFRSEFRGLPAASYGLFGKAPEGLSENEAVILAALIPSPQAPAKQVQERACWIGKRMSPRFQCEALASYFLDEGLKILPIRPSVALAPHVAQKILKAPIGVSTLDLRLQEFVLKTLQHQIRTLKNQNVNDAAALVVENTTGEVLAYLGNLGEDASAFYVDGVMARRQAGSTLKPFLYALAFEKRFLTPGSWMDDSPVDFPVFGGIYRPRNYDRIFHGEKITVRSALGSSLNVPAVRTLNLVGVDVFVRKLKELGIEGLEMPEFYGPSLALGSADVTLWDLVNAYRVFANQGKWTELKLDATSGSQRKPIHPFSPQTAFLISDILSDREARSLTFGLDNPLSHSFWTAAKTGTSKDMRDNWCIGYSEHYTVGVWVGNFSGEPMWNVSGVSGAAPVWSEIINYLHKTETRLNSKMSAQPKIPSGLVRVATGSKSEWYLQGTEPPAGKNEIPKLAAPLDVKITYPTEGTWIARDPDIPSGVQKIVFEHTSSNQVLKWKVNGHEVLSSDGVWAIEPGRMRLSLTDDRGKLLDEVQFHVR